MNPRILWIEGKRAGSPHFAPGLGEKGYDVETVSTGCEALVRLVEFDPDLVVINAANLHTSGKRISRSLRQKISGIPILLILNENPISNSDPNVDVIIALPFTSRKLQNRISKLLPGDSGSILHKGPIRLDLELKRVRCQGREANLTPRLMQLLKIFLENPGVVLDREDLFRRIWNTEYTLDTRTLDVHISWLRHAIEEEPHKPRFLKTIRGIGYRLDI